MRSQVQLNLKFCQKTKKQFLVAVCNSEVALSCSVVWTALSAPADRPVAGAVIVMETHERNGAGGRSHLLFRLRY